MPVENSPRIRRRSMLVKVRENELVRKRQSTVAHAMKHRAIQRNGTLVDAIVPTDSIWLSGIGYSDSANGFPSIGSLVMIPLEVRDSINVPASPSGAKG